MTPVLTQLPLFSAAACAPPQSAPRYVVEANECGIYASRVGWDWWMENILLRPVANRIDWLSIGPPTTDPFATDGKELPEPASVLVVYDPLRVLRTVEAARRIMKRHHDDGCGYCAGCETSTRHSGIRELVPSGECPEKRDLAAIYSDHPDYRKEWAGDR